MGYVQCAYLQASVAVSYKAALPLRIIRIGTQFRSLADSVWII